MLSGDIYRSRRYFWLSECSWQLNMGHGKNWNKSGNSEGSYNTCQYRAGRICDTYAGIADFAKSDKAWNGIWMVALCNAVCDLCDLCYVSTDSEKDSGVSGHCSVMIT